VTAAVLFLLLRSIVPLVTLTEFVNAPGVVGALIVSVTVALSPRGIVPRRHDAPAHTP